jgi:hypothetical protein
MSTGSTLRATHPRLSTLASAIAVVAIAGATVVGLARTVFADATPGDASVSAQKRTLLGRALDKDAHRGVKVRLKHWKAPRVPRPRTQLAPAPVTIPASTLSTAPAVGSLPQTSDDGNSHDE